MTKVLLINPFSPTNIQYDDRSIPVGLLYLASNLEKNGIIVKILDINNEFLHTTQNLEEIESFLRKNLVEYDPDLVGIGVLFTGRFESAITLSKITKEYKSSIPVVLGGIHPTLFAREILEDYNEVDYVIKGEGETSFLDLVKAHFNGGTLANIDGLGYKKDGLVYVNPKEIFIEDLDNLPKPAYHLIDLKKYHFDTSGWFNPKRLPINFPMPIVSSRSCPNQCTFCSMYLLHGKRIRQRSATNVVDEIEFLYNTYGHKYFAFVDDNLTFSKQRTIEICNEIIRRKLDIQFDTPNGISIKTLDEDVIRALVDAGLVRIILAIESGNEYIRNKVMRKGLSTSKIYEVFKILEKYPKLQVKAFFVIGMPQETKETLEDTWQMIQKLKLKRLALFSIIPYPGTEIYKFCLEKNLITVNPRTVYKDPLFCQIKESDVPIIKPFTLTIQDIIDFRQKVRDYLSRITP